MIFLVKWFIFYIGVMIAMCLDNVTWIPTSPEYEDYKKLPWSKKNELYVIAEGKAYTTRLDYIFRYRILSVIKHPRDIFPGIVSSLFLTLTSYLF
jgi:hypothetical protein